MGVQELEQQSLKKIIRLKYYVQRLRSVRTDHEYFAMVVETIIPLIRSLFPALVREWAEQEKAYTEKYQSLQQAIWHETNTARCIDLQNALNKLYHMYDLDDVRYPWVAWVYLMMLEDGWNCDQADFKDKQLLHERCVQDKDWKPTPGELLQLSQREGMLLGRQTAYAESNAIKNKKQGADGFYLFDDRAPEIKRVKKVCLIRRDRFDNYLDVILRAVCGEVISKGDLEFKPYAIELVLEGTYLNLLLRYNEGVLVFNIHSFNGYLSEINIARDFITSMFKSPGTFTELPEGSEGKSASQYLQRIGIKAALDQFFIATKSSRGAALRATRIDFANCSEGTIARLYKAMRGLKFVRTD